MLDDNTVVPFTSSVGSKFLINFEKFKLQEFSIPLISLSLVLVEPSNKVLSLKDLIGIARIIRYFMIENNTVLYYYCDISNDLSISEKNSYLKPNEFRHKLFSCIFNFMKDKDFVKDEIIIKDEMGNCHFISLIAKAEDKSRLTDINIAIQQMNDK
ncbi:MAG: hypothetical protein N4A45_11940 [Flavobacteriales bacterium]|jgi:hypothetical protein|nr:hypothetical protein [Flavobacteriales bacterium]